MWFRQKSRFFYPVPPAPRTAVLSAAFRSQGAIRVFDDPAEIPAFAPQALAGTLSQIESLAGAVDLTHAVIVLRGESDAGLTHAERDRLWRTFRVPAFEQIIAPGGTLQAWECEAHNGLHIESADFDAGGQAVDVKPCACGKSTRRLASGDGSKARSTGVGA